MDKELEMTGRDIEWAALLLDWGREGIPLGESLEAYAARTGREDLL